MALNFLGLGFSLGAEDKGLSAALKNTTSGLSDISKSVVGIGLASAKMIFKAPDFGPAASLAKTLSQDVKTTTTALEAYGVAASKATKAGFAGLNLNRKEMRKLSSEASGIAFDMNTDVGAITKSLASLSQANVDVTKLGFKSLSQYSKFLAVTGADATAFASTLGTMNNRLNMTPDAVKDTLTSVGAIGKKFGIAKEAYAGLTTTVDMLATQVERFPQAWPVDRQQEFIKGTTAVAGALTSLGAPADQAIVSANKLGEQLLKGQTGMANLYSGLVDNLPVTMETLTKHLGEIGPAFDMMSESPDKFMLKMGELIKQVRSSPGFVEEDLNMFKSQMSDTFGPAVLQAFTEDGFDKLGPALKDATKPIKGQDKIMGDLAGAYEDGRTHAERFAIAQDRVQTKLKQVKGVMSDSEYLQQYNKQTKEFLGTMNQLAAKGGPIGKATTLMIDFKNRGVGGALAAQFKWGFALSEGMKIMEPFLAYMPALKVAFLALMSPIGLVAGAIAGLYFLFKDLGKGADSVMRPMIDKIVAEAPVFLAKIWDTLGMAFDAVWRFLASVDWSKVANTVGTAFTKIFNTIFEVLDRIDWNKVGQVLGAILSKAAEVAIIILKGALKLGERILNWLDSVDWNAVGKKIGYFFAEVGTIALGAIVKVISNLPEIMVKIFKHAVSLITGVLDGIRDYLVKKFPEATKPIVFIFEMIKAAVKIVGVAFQLAWKAIGFVLGTIWSILKGIFGVIGWIVGKVAGALGAAFGLIKDAVSWIWDKLKSVGSAIGSVVGAIGGAISKVGGFFGGVGSAISGLFSSSSKGTLMVSNVMKKQMEEFKKKQAEAAAAVKARHEAWVKGEHAAGRATEGFVKTVEGEIIKSTDAFLRYEKDALGVIKQVAHDASKYIKGTISGDLYKTFDDAQKEMVQMRAMLKAKSGGKSLDDKALDELLEFQQGKMDEYFKQTGVNWHKAFEIRDQTLNQFRIEATLLDAAKKQGAGYYTALTSMQSKLSEQTYGVRMAMEKLKTAGKEGSEEYLKLDAQLKKMGADGVTQMNQYSDLLSGNTSKMMDQYVRGAESAMAALRLAGKEGTEEYTKLANQQVERTRAAEVAAHVLSEVHRANAIDLMAKIPEAAAKTRDTVQNMMDQIAKAQTDELYTFYKTTDLKGAAFDAAEKVLREKYKAQSDAITKAVQDNNNALVNGSERGITESLSKIQGGLDKMTQEVATKTQQNATEIQKSFAVTGETALESVKEIGAIKPETFRKNMQAVQNSFLGFLKVMDDKGKVLMTNTNKSFDKMWETMSSGWKANQKVLEDFTSGLDKFLSAFWKTVVDKAGIASNQLVAMAKGIETSMRTMARTINIMDLLASPDQINSWAASVVSALASAMRGGAVADSLLSSSYTKALAMAGEIQRATPDGATMTNPAQTSGASSATATLLSSINNPAWTDKKAHIPTQLVTMNETLYKILDATGHSGKPAPKPPKSPQPTQAK